ncbi:hypothetical protein GOODEAATRI_028434 [Goodea atripinnis]|uniref:Uncharacterized protein n=1 Tax=Goodea atripinnis TaxID=208336 RepID=A0ABV0N5Y5_9TELE
MAAPVDLELKKVVPKFCLWFGLILSGILSRQSSETQQADAGRDVHLAQQHTALRGFILQSKEEINNLFISVLSRVLMLVILSAVMYWVLNLESRKDAASKSFWMLGSLYLSLRYVRILVLIDLVRTFVLHLCFIRCCLLPTVGEVLHHLLAQAYCS